MLLMQEAYYLFCVSGSRHRL